jgi:hypothetical protein
MGQPFGMMNRPVSRGDQQDLDIAGGGPAKWKHGILATFEPGLGGRSTIVVAFVASWNSILGFFSMVRFIAAAFRLSSKTRSYLNESTPPVLKIRG